MCQHNTNLKYVNQGVNMAKKRIKKSKKNIWEIIVKVLLTILFLALGLFLFELPNYLSVSESLKGIIETIAIIIVFVPLVEIISIIDDILSPDKTEDKAPETKDSKDSKKGSFAGRLLKASAVLVTAKVITRLFSKD